MTDREEVIKQLKKLKSFHNGSYGEAINFAIESIKVDMAYDLEYEKAESYCDDCISRQVAIDALGECPMNWTDSDGEITAERDWKDTVEMLKSLPSVIPQPKTEVLDKIRDEIDELDTLRFSSGERIYKDEVLDIIDKYRK